MDSPQSDKDDKKLLIYETGRNELTPGVYYPSSPTSAQRFVLYDSFSHLEYCVFLNEMQFYSATNELNFIITQLHLFCIIILLKTSLVCIYIFSGIKMQLFNIFLTFL